MTDRPMLFSGAMVRAMLEGRKTQTRRVLVPQPPEWANFCEQPLMFNVLHQWVPSGLWRWAEVEGTPPRALRQWPIDEEGLHYWKRVPFAVGDRLWVRESWSVGPVYDKTAPRDINPDNVPNWCGIYYPATKKPIGCRIRPGIHMPRWASRLTLIVTDVRVQQLQDISETEAIAEGIEDAGNGGAFVQLADAATYGTPKHCYAALWDSLNAKRGYGWDANPWVAAITFTVHRANVDALPVEKAA